VRAGLGLVALGLVLLVYPAFLFLLVAALRGHESPQQSLLELGAAGGLVQAVAFVGLVVKQAGMWLALAAPRGSPARRASRWMVVCLVLEVLLVLVIFQGQSWNELVATTYSERGPSTLGLGWMSCPAEAFTVLRTALLAAWLVQGLSFLVFLHGVARSFGAGRLRWNVGVCLLAFLVVLGPGSLVGLALEKQATPHNGPLAFLSYELLPLFGVTPAAESSLVPPWLSGVSLLAPGPPRLALHVMLGVALVLLVWVVALVVCAREVIVRRTQSDSLSDTASAWGGVHAGLGLVAVGLLLVVGSSAILFFFAAVLEGVAPQGVLRDLDSGGGLVRALLLGLPAVGLVLRQAGMWLALAAPRGSPARRASWWLPVPLVLEALLVLALLFGHSCNEQAAMQLNDRLIKAFPGAWLVYGLKWFAVPRLGLLAVWALQGLSFLVFLRGVARSLPAERLKWDVGVGLVAFLVVVGLGASAAAIWQWHTPPQDSPLASLSYYLLPLFGMTPPAEAELVPRELSAGDLAAGTDRLVLYLALGATIVLAAACVLLVIAARKAINRAFRHA
jgi:hypothetical protein